MSSADINYHRARAAAERALAFCSKDPAIAGVHEKMAELYDKMIVMEQGQMDRRRQRQAGIVTSIRETA